MLSKEGEREELALAAAVMTPRMSFTDLAWPAYLVNC